MSPNFQFNRDTLAPGVVRAIFQNAAVYFALDERVHAGLVVHPGQPISFVWEVYEFTSAGTPNPDWAGAHGAVSYLGNPVWPDNTARSGQIEVAALPPDAYRYGSGNSLTLTVTKADGTATLTTALGINLVLDAPGAEVFAWDSTIPTTVRWKQDTYTVGGVLRNPSMFTALTFTPVLTETVLFEGRRRTDPVPIGDVTPPRNLGAPSGSSTFTLNPGATSRCAWAPINQAWTPWFNRALFLITGPMGKMFDYTVTFDVSDVYGNVYPEGTSADRQVFVAVELWKDSDVALAATLQVAAVVFTIAAVALGWTVVGAVIAAAAAVTAEAAAQIFGVAALDPPAPDPAFTTLVAVPDLPKLEQPGAELMQFLALVHLNATVQSLLSQTHGKMLGALLAGDAKSAASQAAQYGALTARMAGAATALADITDAAGHTLRTIDPAALVDHAQLWQQTGMPADVTDTLTKAGMTKDGLAGLQAFLAEPGNAYLLSDPAALLTSMVSTAGTIALAFRAEAPRIMNLASRSNGKPLTLPEITLTGPFQV